MARSLISGVGLRPRITGALDQLLETWPVGRAVAGDAGADTIRAAVESVLGDNSYVKEARECPGALVGPEGITPAAEVIEPLLTAADGSIRARGHGPR